MSNIKTFVEDMAADEIVQELAKCPDNPTTQNGYDYYMTAILQFGEALENTPIGFALKLRARTEGVSDAELRETVQLLAVAILRKAGGNIRGIDAAARVLNLPI